MNRSDCEREIATEITFMDSNRTEKLTYVGSGTNANVYRIESGDLIKEFCPKRGNQPLMSRKNGMNDMLTELEGLSLRDREILEERRALFEYEEKHVRELDHRYKSENDNMFVVSKNIAETSLGKCQWCNYVGGQTLKSYFEESKKSSTFQEHFLSVLPLIISLYDEIAFYHRDKDHGVDDNGILNLDIKPDNILAIKSQGQYIGVRNLDFGSIKRIDDKIRDDGKYDAGLLSSILTFARNNNFDISHNHVSENNYRFDPIISKFFSSKHSFYDPYRIECILEEFIISQKSRESIISRLKSLDIIAAWKTFLCAFDDTDSFFIKENNEAEAEQDKVIRIFTSIFENNNLTVSDSLFESYNIYHQLYEITVRIFSGFRRYRLSASEIADRLRNILCILKGITRDKSVEGQEHTKAINSCLCGCDKLLEAYGLRSIRDILEFCETKNKGVKISPKDLVWFLTMGEAHE